MKKNNGKQVSGRTITLGILLLFISLGVIFPLCLKGFPVTDDADWMVIRLSAFYQALVDGQFPVRFLGRLNNNYGYPVSNFLYPGFLYLGSLVHFLGFSFQDTVKVLLGGSVVICGLALFFWLLRFFCTESAFLGAVTFLFSPYTLFNLYKRGSVGELLATAGLLVSVLLVEYGFRLTFPLVIAFLFISHNTLAMLYGILLFFYIIVRKKEKLLFPFFIGIAISSFFWLPAFFERVFVNFAHIQVAIPKDHFSQSNVLIFQSIPFILPFIYGLTAKRKIYEFWFFGGIMMLALAMASSFSALFWKSSFLILYIQFPYRFLSLLGISGPFLFAWMVDTAPKILRAGCVILAVCFFAFSALVQYQKIVVLPREEGYFTTNEATTTVADEYMPKWATEKKPERANTKLEFISGKGTVRSIQISTKRLDASIESMEESTLQFNTLYYPGWGATVDKKPVPISYKNRFGVMEIHVPKGNHVISIEFRETVFRFIADLISVAGIVLFIMYALLPIGAKKIRLESRLSFIRDLWS